MSPIGRGLEPRGWARHCAGTRWVGLVGRRVIGTHWWGLEALPVPRDSLQGLVAWSARGAGAARTSTGVVRVDVASPSLLEVCGTPGGV